MATKNVSVVIKGLSALLMHAFPMIPLEAIDKRSPAEQAEHAAYRDPETNELYIPGINIQRCLVNGATYIKGKGRASLQKPVAACVLITPERCGLGVSGYEIDMRPVVIQATKGRIIRCRPRLAEWGVHFSIEYDNDLLKESELRQVVDNA